MLGRQLAVSMFFRSMLQIIGGNFGRMSNSQKLRLLLRGDGLGGEDGCAVAQCFPAFLFRSHSLLIYLTSCFQSAACPGGLVPIDGRVRGLSWRRRLLLVL